LGEDKPGLMESEEVLVSEPCQQWDFLDCLPMGKWCLVIVSLSKTQRGPVRDLDWMKMWRDCFSNRRRRPKWNTVETHQDNLEFKSQQRTIITRNDVERIINGADGNNHWKSVEKGRPLKYQWLVLRDAILVIKLEATTKSLSKNIMQSYQPDSVNWDWLENMGKC